MNAANYVNVDWPFEFAEVIGCARCSRATDSNLMRDSEENVPQPGYIGSAYENKRLLLIGQNPWLPNSALSANDRAYTAALRSLRDDPSEARYAELRLVLDHFIPSWPVQNNYFPLAECGVRLDEIAYLNIVRCRTGEHAPNANTVDNCLRTHFEKWLDKLNPSCVVFIGKWGAERGQRAVTSRRIPFATIDRNRVLTSEQRATNRGEVAAFVRKSVQLDGGKAEVTTGADTFISRAILPYSRPTHLDPEQILKLLAELKKLGFNDEVFWRLHHFRARKRETIASFRSYCEKTPVFRAGGANQRVGQRLAFVLARYRERNLPPGNTPVMIDLAEIAFREI
jgi:hypothetical protein